MSTMLGATLYEIVVPVASNQISVNYPLSNRFSVIELISFLACGHGKEKIFQLDWESWQVFLSTSKDRLIWPLGILLLSPNPCQFPSGSQRDFGLWEFFFFLQILSFWSWKILFPTTNASKFPSGILRLDFGRQEFLFPWQSQQDFCQDFGRLEFYFQLQIEKSLVRGKFRAAKILPGIPGGNENPGGQNLCWIPVWFLVRAWQHPKKIPGPFFFYTVFTTNWSDKGKVRKKLAKYAKREFRQKVQVCSQLAMQFSFTFFNQFPCFLKHCKY